MLSAVKNFALTFVISLLVFSLLAYFIVGYVLTNLSSITGGTTDSTETTTSPAPVITDDNGGIIDIEIPDTGTSFNLLIALTDYDPALYVYDPAVLDIIAGRQPKTVHEPLPVPSDLAAPRSVSLVPDSDPEDGDGSVTDTGDPFIPGGFYTGNYQKLRTTLLVLMRFDRERSQVTFTAFSDEAVTVMDGRYIELGDIYATYGKDILCDAIHSMTGCMVDGYVIVDPENFKSLISTLGGIYFNVPCEMNFGDVVIGSGSQGLDGETALRVLGYGLYVENGESREKTAVDFLRTVLSNITQITNYPNAESLFDSLSACVDTNYTKDKLMANRDFIFRYSQLPNETRDPAMRTMQVGDRKISVIDTQATLSKFADYRRILPEDTTKQ